MPRSLRLALSTLVLCVLAVAGCEGRSPTGGKSGSPPPPAKAEQPIELSIVYGSEKKTWFEEQARAFERASTRTRSGRPIRVVSKPMGSGEAADAILRGELKPHVYSPASSAYVNLLNHKWLSQAGKTQAIAPAGDPLVLSPVVIAMWKPMAEALGWPTKQLGWTSLLEVNANPEGWAAHGRPEWGKFKLGHTHPEFSNSGLLSVLAEAYAGAKKTRGLTAEDLAEAKTQQFISSVEGTLVHYGKSTGFFADKMLERGPAYISAAVLYENLVIESYSKPTPFPLVAIYPKEGTFWSDHPYSVLEADWVGAEEKEAAQAFLAFLKQQPAQERALQLGFRPANPSIKIVSPIDAAHGVDPLQPQTLLEVPRAEVLVELLSVWSKNKKATEVVFIFDKSGSMHGKPLQEAKEGAKAFLSHLGDQDTATLIFFDHVVHPPIGPVQIGRGRDELLARIDGAVASGGTALYDAIASGRKLALERAAKRPGRIHAVVVMTDGKDESSKASLAAVKSTLGGEGGDEVRLFTIAYGQAADPRVLDQLAEAAKGASAKGTSENIVQVYQDVAAFF
jgi:Ca-activated chloride channel homolog